MFRGLWWIHQLWWDRLYTLRCRNGSKHWENSMRYDISHSNNIWLDRRDQWYYPSNHIFFLIVCYANELWRVVKVQVSPRDWLKLFSDPCSAGTYRTLEQTTCESCVGNTISSEGASFCTSCVGGKVANTQKTVCGEWTKLTKCSKVI